METAAEAEHLSAGPSLYGGGGLSPASGTAESFNEQLYRYTINRQATCNKRQIKQTDNNNVTTIYNTKYDLI